MLEKKIGGFPVCLLIVTGIACSLAILVSAAANASARSIGGCMLPPGADLSKATCPDVVPTPQTWPQQITYRRVSPQRLLAWQAAATKLQVSYAWGVTMTERDPSHHIGVIRFDLVRAFGYGSAYGFVLGPNDALIYSFSDPLRGNRWFLQRPGAPYAYQLASPPLVG